MEARARAQREVRSPHGLPALGFPCPIPKLSTESAAARWRSKAALGSYIAARIYFRAGAANESSQQDGDDGPVVKIDQGFRWHQERRPRSGTGYTSRGPRQTHVKGAFWVGIGRSCVRVVSWPIGPTCQPRCWHLAPLLRPKAKAAAHRETPIGCLGSIVAKAIHNERVTGAWGEGSLAWHPSGLE